MFVDKTATHSGMYCKQNLCDLMRDVYMQEKEKDRPICKILMFIRIYYLTYSTFISQPHKSIMAKHYRNPRI